MLELMTFFSSQPLEIYVDDETKLTLHGLQQHYVKLDEAGKNRKLNELLDTLEFNQVYIEISVSPGVQAHAWRIGRHLREVRRSCCRTRQALGLLQLPQHQHSLFTRPG